MGTAERATKSSRAMDIVYAIQPVLKLDGAGERITFDCESIAFADRQSATDAIPLMHAKLTETLYRRFSEGEDFDVELVVVAKLKDEMEARSALRRKSKRG
jgi:hypothetical protein